MTQFALEVMRFADEEQTIYPILEKYYSKNYKQDCIIKAVIEVLEQSLGILFGNNAQDDEKIIQTFMKRLICRSFHGTRTTAAKNIVQNGISFDPQVKGYDYSEFEKLIVECNLKKAHWPFALDKKRNDSGKFYVSSMLTSALSYARNSTPECFLSFKKWGANEKGELNTEKLEREIIKQNPLVTNVKRIIKFVENHWIRCASKKNNTAILIIERCESDKELYHHSKRFKGNIMDAYFDETWISQAYTDLGNKILSTDYMNKNKWKMLINAKAMVECFQGNNMALSAKNTATHPVLIHALKIPMT